MHGRRLAFFISPQNKQAHPGTFSSLPAKLNDVLHSTSFNRKRRWLVKQADDNPSCSEFRPLFCIMRCLTQAKALKHTHLWWCTGRSSRPFPSHRRIAARMLWPRTAAYWKTKQLRWEITKYKYFITVLKPIFQVFVLYLSFTLHVKGELLIIFILHDCMMPY